MITGLVKVTMVIATTSFMKLLSLWQAPDHRMSPLNRKYYPGFDFINLPCFVFTYYWFIYPKLQISESPSFPKNTMTMYSILHKMVEVMAMLTVFRTDHCCFSTWHQGYTRWNKSRTQEREVCKLREKDSEGTCFPPTWPLTSSLWNWKYKVISLNSSVRSISYANHGNRAPQTTPA